MQSATLDTSCALNFLMTDEEPDDDLMDVISLALGGKIAANVSEEAFAEVEGTTDADVRKRRITRLKTFGRLEIPTGRVEERDEIAERLHLAIFPDATPGSNKDDHNWRDCRQLATHKLIGRDAFVTRDERLLRGAEAAAAEGIEVLGPKQFVDTVKAETEAAGLPSYPGISVRDADLEKDEGDIRRVLSSLAADHSARVRRGHPVRCQDL